MSATHNTPHLVLHVSKLWLILAAAIVLVPWGLLLVIHSHEQAQSEHSTSLWTVPSHKGPWGELKVIRIVTEPPAESLTSYLDYPAPTWFFKGYTPEAYRQLLASAGLTPSQREALAAAAVWDAKNTEVSVKPDDDLVRSLSPESRAALYGALSLFPQNVFQNEPFRFRADLANEWFANSGVPQEVVDRVFRLTYRRGKTLLFSDPHLVVPTVASAPEQIRLLKTMARQSTLMVQVHITEKSDIDALVNYWSAVEGRAKDIRPILESIAKVPGGYDVDISHLLPRFARKRVYTYPSYSGDKGEVLYDCHWNSMNFFNDPPDDRFSDPATVIRALETDYTQVIDDFRFGDVVLFMRSNTQAIHSAVYIADNIVFTKNGPNLHSPWILMQLETLVSHYSTNVDLQLRGYRKKAAPHP